MKVIILAGGLPSTLIEEDEKMPKPMAEIGGRPLLWHIMKQYSHYGFNDFIICTGYKGNVIKDYFMNFYIYQSDITVDLQTNDVTVHRKLTEDWKVSVIDTGLNSNVIERLYMVRDYIGDEAVFVSYGDCLSDIDVKEMLEQHKREQANATFAMAHPTGRNEILEIDSKGNYSGKSNHIIAQNAWVNACNMILEQEVFNCFSQKGRNGVASVLDCVACHQSIHTYRHDGFWSPVETARDKHLMETLWETQKAPWKVWVD